MNKVCLTGRITKDPEMRFTQNAVANVRFTIAVDRGMKDAQGNRQADFINCVAWRTQAEFISKYVKKGQMLAVEGRIQTGSFQGQDGVMHYTTDIVVDNVENLSPRDPNQTPANNYGTRPTPAPNYQGYQGTQNPYQQPVQNNYQQGYNPGVPQGFNSASNAAPAKEAPKSYNVDVADDDLPF